MTQAVFIKRYADPARGDAARSHLQWLAGLDSGVHLPHLHRGSAHQLIFDHLRGRQPRLSDLPNLAAVLGQLHGAAYARELHAAQLHRPFVTSSGLAIRDFHTGRRHLLDQLGVDTAGLPAAIYKDANLRNFVMTTSGPAIVDFDDLTLAPFGYDLAKLVVATAMTYGRVHESDIETALHTYNRHVEAAGGPTGSCSLPQLARYSEMHHLLTVRYLHRHGYRHAWPHVRPWAAPTAVPAPR
jgi:hypothetical protein